MPAVASRRSSRACGRAAREAAADAGKQREPRRAEAAREERERRAYHRSGLPRRWISTAATA